MNKSFTISFVLIFYCSILSAQDNINSYKYILVPKQFEFQKSQDQYQLNSLTKFLFNKAGYSVLFTDEQYPEDLVNNHCLALKAKVNNNPSLLKTKMSIDLYNCQDKVVYSTKEGISKEKEYKKAYQEAIRLAFVELEEMNYVYDNNSLNSPKIEKGEAVDEVATAPIIKRNEPVVQSNQHVKTAPSKVVEKLAVKTIEGKFNVENRGVMTILKKGDNFVVVEGDENFELGMIYKTSKPSMFIIKWVAYKHPQLVEMDDDGNLSVDTENGVRIYKRVD